MKQALLGIARTGVIGSLFSVGALAAASVLEGKAAVRPINATSHWRRGAGDVARVDATHTGIGYGTHLAATMFWAALFELWQRVRPSAGPRARIGRAAIVSAVAAAIDYGATPKRFTPGWELVLMRRSMAFGYAAMAIGFALAPHPPRRS